MRGKDVRILLVEDEVAHAELIHRAFSARDPAVNLSMPPVQPPVDEPVQLVEAAAHKDPMTGFYHRRHFVEQLEHA